MKKILILGGTMFVGRTLTERLIGSGKYDVTLFNRGRSGTDLFKDVNQIHGDREGAGVEKIYDQHWDRIIDFSGYYPVTFEKFLNGIKGKVGRYIFISTVSVFDLRKYEGQLITEAFATHACSAAQMVSPLPDGYGEKKAEMERLLLQHEELDKIIFRPSYIYGKYDWTQRFYYWLYRVQNCSQFLLPDNGVSQKLSLTNADDLTEALLMAIEINDHATIYNAVSTPSITIREMLQVAATAYGKSPEVITVDKKQLDELSLKPSQFPLVLPYSFGVDNTLWEKDFPFQRTSLKSTLLEMRDDKAAASYPMPSPGGALEVEREQQAIERFRKVGSV